MQFHTPPNVITDTIASVQASPFYTLGAILAGAIACVILATYITRGK